MKATWNALPNKIIPMISDFSGGLNLYETKDNEASETVNLCGGRVSRLPRKLLPYTIPNAYVNYFTLLANGHFGAYYYDEQAETFAWRDVEDNIVMCMMAGYYPVSSIIFDKTNADSKVHLMTVGPNYLYVTDPVTQTTRVDMLAQTANFITTNGKYLFTASSVGEYLIISAERSYTNWIGLGSAFFKIAKDEKNFCTGLACLRSRVIYFSNNSMHEVYGDNPKNFSPKTVSDTVGCISSNSICHIGDSLYWVGADGVYKYKGGTAPKKISGKVKKFIDGINLSDLKIPPGAGTDGIRYYVSVVYNDPKKNVMLVYDTDKDIWHTEDNPGFVRFVNRGQTMYGMTVDGRVYEMNPEISNEVVEWSWTSKPFYGQHWYKIFLMADLDEGTCIDCTIMCDGVESYTMSVIGEKTRHCIEIPLGCAANAESIQIRLQGRGGCILHGLERQVKEGYHA